MSATTTHEINQTVETARATGRPGVDHGWVRVCTSEQILPDTGVAALVLGRQVAVFRLRDGRLFAIDNHDPCSGANVLARGIVGDADGVAVVASPIHKQRFELATGYCLDADVQVGTHEVRLRDDVVEVARP